MDESRIRFLDLFNAMTAHSALSEKLRSIYYRRAACQLFHLDDDAVLLWEKAIRKDYITATTTDEEWKNLHYFNNFIDFCSITRYSDEYHADHYDAKMISNAIRLAGPRNRNGYPLIFIRSNRELLAPHYRLRDELSSRDLLEAEGILKLHEAWKTTNDEEKQKIKRFVAAHAHEIDAAITIIESRFVNTLEQLESFMEQSGETSALMDGAL